MRRGLEHIEDKEMKWMVPIAVTLVLVAMMMSPNIVHAQFLTTAPNMPGDRGLDSALGSGHVLDGGTQFLINVAAHSRSLGEKPSGHYHLETVPGGTDTAELDADVTCLNVAGNLATVGGFVTRFVVNGIVVTGVVHGILQIFEDNHLSGVPDAVSNVTSLPNAPSICPPPDPAAATFVVNQGNIVVHDAGL